MYVDESKIILDTLLAPQVQGLSQHGNGSSAPCWSFQANGSRQTTSDKHCWTGQGKIIRGAHNWTALLGLLGRISAGFSSGKPLMDKLLHGSSHHILLPSGWGWDSKQNKQQRSMARRNSEGSLNFANPTPWTHRTYH